MNRFLSGTLLLASVFAIDGCNRPTPPTAKKPPAANKPRAQPVVGPPAPAKVIAEETVPPATPEEEPVAETNETSSTAPTDSPHNEAAVETVTTTPVAKPDPERVIVLAETGPIVMDIFLHMDDESYRQKVDALIDEVISVGDTDEDGQTAWKELMSSEKFIYGQYGNPQIGNEQQRVEFAKTYDINSNKYVDRDEVLGFLRQNASSNQFFYLDESDTQDETVTASPIFRWLDTNEDDLLDEQERTAAVKRIWKNDTEDDRIIRANDFGANVDNNVARQRRRRRAPRKTIVLGKYTEWSKTLYALEEKYAYGNPLTVHDVPDFANLFALLDSDHDEYLSPREFSEIANIAPHLSVAIHFGRESDERISIEHVDGDLPLTSVSVRGDQLQIAVADSIIELSANEPNRQASIDQQIKTAFQQFDSDKDEAFSQEEFSSLSGVTQVPFATIDTNNDDSIDRDELTASIRNRQMAQQSQIAGQCRYEPTAVIRTTGCEQRRAIDGPRSRTNPGPSAPVGRKQGWRHRLERKTKCDLDPTYSRRCAESGRHRATRCSATAN